MGNCACFNSPDHRNYKVIRKIGKGAFAQVFEVQLIETQIRYALKAIPKYKIIAKKCYKQILNERKSLSNCRSNYITNLHRAFQDRQNLFMLLDYANGGDLRQHINSKTKFAQSFIKHIAICVIQALSAIHQAGIIHRDIKPENLVFDKQGYLLIADFGISLNSKDNSASITSGTPGYMAPQVILRQSHNYMVDYYALGIILFELICGKRPYTGSTKKQIYEEMMSRQVKIKFDPKNSWTKDCIEFVNALIDRKVDSRLGGKGIDELKAHCWLSSVDWKAYEQRKLKLAFIPQQPKSQNKDFSTTQLNQKQKESLELLSMEQIQCMFVDFDYSRNQMILNSAFY